MAGTFEASVRAEWKAQVATDLKSEDSPDERAIFARFALFRTLFAAYRTIGRYFVSLAVITVALAAVSFALTAWPLLSPGLLLSSQTALLAPAGGLASLVLSSAVLAVVGVFAYRRQLIGDRYSVRFGSRELRFALVLLLFGVVLVIPGELLVLLYHRIADPFERWTGYPSDLFWPTAIFFWRLFVTALLFFVFPAIALDRQHPLANAARTARRVLPTLFLYYSIGLLPWTVLPELGFHYFMRGDAARTLFAGALLQQWSMICTMALAGAAYGELLKSERSSGVFEAFD